MQTLNHNLNLARGVAALLLLLAAGCTAPGSGAPPWAGTSPWAPAQGPWGGVASNQAAAVQAAYPPAAPTDRFSAATPAAAPSAAGAPSPGGTRPADPYATPPGVSFASYPPVSPTGPPGGVYRSGGTYLADGTFFPNSTYPIVRAQNAVPYAGAPGGFAPGFGPPAGAPGTVGAGPAAPPGVDRVFAPGEPAFNPPSIVAPGTPYMPPVPMADLDAYVQETRTGRFMFGVGVNSDAGVTGQVTIDERNFDWQRIPRGWGDVVNGTAFRGAGQGFRLEAMPGTKVQRYMMSFTEPYLFDTPVSLNLNAFFYDRLFYDWNEQRFGGRVALGYYLTHDLSASLAVRAENIDIHDPRVRGVPELEAVLGKSDFFSGRFTLTYDTRDIPFAPTEGSLVELALEQAFGTFDFPRAEVDLRKYYMVYEHADGSQRHTLSFLLRYGVSGAQTPIYENFFAGGFSTLRGFAFRGASPVSGGVTVGGQSRLLASAEYMFPITADDMIKGVAFVDAGTVERQIEMHADNFRVAPGLGLRINIPALGPAPLALDFAIPVASAPTDNEQIFSFFFGMGR